MIAARLRDVPQLGPARVRGRLFDFDSYPGAVLDPDAKGEIVGDLLSIESETLLDWLDAYEGFDAAHPDASFYRRTETIARRPDGSAQACAIYVYARDPGPAPELKGGDWAARRR